MIRADEVLRFSLFSGLLCVGLSACANRDVDLDGPPVQLPTTPSGVETLALRDGVIGFRVDDSRLFFTTANGVQSCVYANCAATLVRYESWYSYWLAFTDTDVFFGGEFDRGAVSCPKGGCTAPPTAFSDEKDPLVFDSHFAYWSGEFKIYRCPLANCGEIPQVVADEVAGPGERVPYGSSLRIQDSTAFWEGAGVPDPADLETRFPLRSAPSDGSAPPITFASAVSSFTADSTSVYWVDNMSRVQRCPLTGCDAQGPVTLVTTTTPKSFLTVDAKGIYWLEPEDQSFVQAKNLVRYCPLAGCGNAEPQILTPSPVAQFALDSEHLYWNDGDNTVLIHRMQKPTP
jgi:hypothetical protein